MIDKKQIIEKSAQLFKTSGIRTNTMDDIAAAVGISKKTLYMNVADKNELINEVISNEYTNTKNTLEKITSVSKNSIEELLRFNAYVVQFLNSINPVAVVDLRKLYVAIHSEWKANYNKLFFNYILSNIKKGKSTGIFRSDINEELITQIHTDKLDQYHENDGISNSTLQRTEKVKEMATYYIRGLVTNQGELILNKHITEFNKYLNE